MKKIVVSKYKDKKRIHPDENRKKLPTPSYIVEISMNYNKNDKMLKSLFDIKQEQAVLSLSNSDLFFFESLHNISYNIDNSFSRLLINKKYEIMISTRERMNFANKIILNSSLNNAYIQNSYQNNYHKNSYNENSGYNGKKYYNNYNTNFNGKKQFIDKRKVNQNILSIHNFIYNRNHQNKSSSNSIRNYNANNSIYGSSSNNFNRNNIKTNINLRDSVNNHIQSFHANDIISEQQNFSKDEVSINISPIKKRFVNENQTKNPNIIYQSDTDDENNSSYQSITNSLKDVKFANDIKPKITKKGKNKVKTNKNRRDSKLTFKKSENSHNSNESCDYNNENYAHNLNTNRSDMTFKINNQIITNQPHNTQNNTLLDLHFQSFNADFDNTSKKKTSNLLNDFSGKKPTENINYNDFKSFNIDKKSFEFPKQMINVLLSPKHMSSSDKNTNVLNTNQNVQQDKDDKNLSKNVGINRHFSKSNTMISNKTGKQNLQGLKNNSNNPFTWVSESEDSKSSPSGSDTLKHLNNESSDLNMSMIERSDQSNSKEKESENSSLIVNVKENIMRKMEDDEKSFHSELSDESEKTNDKNVNADKNKQVNYKRKKKLKNKQNNNADNNTNLKTKVLSNKVMVTKSNAKRNKDKIGTHLSTKTLTLDDENVKSEQIKNQLSKFRELRDRFQKRYDNYTEKEKIKNQEAEIIEIPVIKEKKNYEIVEYDSKVNSSNNIKVVSQSNLSNSIDGNLYRTNDGEKKKTVINKYGTQKLVTIVDEKCKKKPRSLSKKRKTNIKLETGIINIIPLKSDDDEEYDNIVIDNDSEYPLNLYESTDDEKIFNEKVNTLKKVNESPIKVKLIESDIDTEDEILLKNEIKQFRETTLNINKFIFSNYEIEKRILKLFNTVEKSIYFYLKKKYIEELNPLFKDLESNKNKKKFLKEVKSLINLIYDKEIIGKLDEEDKELVLKGVKVKNKDIMKAFIQFISHMSRMKLLHHLKNICIKHKNYIVKKNNKLEAKKQEHLLNNVVLNFNRLSNVVKLNRNALQNFKSNKKNKKKNNTDTIFGFDSDSHSNKTTKTIKTIKSNSSKVDKIIEYKRYLNNENIENILSSIELKSLYKLTTLFDISPYSNISSSRNVKVDKIRSKSFNKVVVFKYKIIKKVNNVFGTSSIEGDELMLNSFSEEEDNILKNSFSENIFEKDYFTNEEKFYFRLALKNKRKEFINLMLKYEKLNKNLYAFLPLAKEFLQLFKSNNLTIFKNCEDSCNKLSEFNKSFSSGSKNNKNINKSFSQHKSSSQINNLILPNINSSIFSRKNERNKTEKFGFGSFNFKKVNETLNRINNNNNIFSASSANNINCTPFNNQNNNNKDKFKSETNVFTNKDIVNSDNNNKFISHNNLILPKLIITNQDDSNSKSINTYESNIDNKTEQYRNALNSNESNVNLALSDLNLSTKSMVKSLNNNSSDDKKDTSNFISVKDLVKLDEENVCFGTKNVKLTTKDLVLSNEDKKMIESKFKNNSPFLKQSSFNYNDTCIIKTDSSSPNKKFIVGKNSILNKLINRKTKKVKRKESQSILSGSNKKVFKEISYNTKDIIKSVTKNRNKKIEIIETEKVLNNTRKKSTLSKTVVYGKDFKLNFNKTDLSKITEEKIVKKEIVEERKTRFKLDTIREKDDGNKNEEKADDRYSSLTKKNVRSNNRKSNISLTIKADKYSNLIARIKALEKYKILYNFSDKIFLKILYYSYSILLKNKLIDINNLEYSINRKTNLSLGLTDLIENNSKEDQIELDKIFQEVVEISECFYLSNEEIISKLLMTYNNISYDSDFNDDLIEIYKRFILLCNISNNSSETNSNDLSVKKNQSLRLNHNILDFNLRSNSSNMIFAVNSVNNSVSDPTKYTTNNYYNFRDIYFILMLVKNEDMFISEKYFDNLYGKITNDSFLYCIRNYVESKIFSEFNKVLENFDRFYFDYSSCDLEKIKNALNSSINIGDEELKIKLKLVNMIKNLDITLIQNDEKKLKSLIFIIFFTPIIPTIKTFLSYFKVSYEYLKELRNEIYANSKIHEIIEGDKNSYKTIKYKFTSDEYDLNLKENKSNENIFGFGSNNEKDIITESEDEKSEDLSLSNEEEYMKHLILCELMFTFMKLLFEPNLKIINFEVSKTYGYLSNLINGNIPNNADSTINTSILEYSEIKDISKQDFISIIINIEFNINNSKICLDSYKDILRSSHVELLKKYD